MTGLGKKILPKFVTTLHVFHCWDLIMEQMKIKTQCNAQQTDGTNCGHHKKHSDTTEMMHWKSPIINNEDYSRDTKRGSIST